MAGERTLNFGADETDARWQMEDAGDGGNFVLARDLDGATVLLEYDATASEWVSRGPVNMDGNDLSNVGEVSSTAVSTEKIDIGNAAGSASLSSNQTISSGAATKVNLDTVDIEDADAVDVQTSNNRLQLQMDGTYLLTGFVRWDGGSFSSGDITQSLIRVNGTNVVRKLHRMGGAVDASYQATIVQQISSNDVVELFVFQNSGSDQTISGATTDVKLQAVKLA